MLHIEILRNKKINTNNKLVLNALGQYYTGKTVGFRLAQKTASYFAMANNNPKVIEVIDPFGGDGRLVLWLIQFWHNQGFPSVKWQCEIWDIEDKGFEEAEKQFGELRSLPTKITVNFRRVDTFLEFISTNKQYDIVITNPPWEQLKPDKREIIHLPKHLREEYIVKLKKYDEWISAQFPLSQPKKKFAGWGTNLSRVGFETSWRLTKRNGIFSSVLPASFLADTQTTNLRKSFIENNRLLDIAYYPAEAKLFDTADVASTTIVSQISCESNQFVPLFTQTSPQVSKTAIIPFNPNFLKLFDFIFPVSFGGDAINLLTRTLSTFPKWEELEKISELKFWAGREVDETNSSEWLNSDGDSGPLFIKGKMIDRYSVRDFPTKSVAKNGWKAPPSIKYPRISWRDVSRPNQKRRMIATIIPSNWIAGNSLGIAHFQDENPIALHNLLAIMNSTTFEFHLRAFLATGHVSLSSIRKVPIPSIDKILSDKHLSQLVEERLGGSKEHESLLDAYVAKNLYNLSRIEYQTVIDLFTKLSLSEKQGFLFAYDLLLKDNIKIANNVTAKLSELDLAMIKCVPEGGNWKNIPDSIPSKRLEQIRAAFKRGEGSRSTYYGRLKRDRPAYTINTYFSRPGNGCHIHYEQNRVLSQREAARLQSFPDSFEFLGSQSAIQTQIGNAVPPLMAYQIANSLGKPGLFIDLFAGAGGLGLGFKWAGWHPIIANDISEHFLNSYARNVHRNILVGDFSEQNVFESLVSICKKMRVAGIPFWVLGGPPCQGFSTAGNKRSMQDPRNQLVWTYIKFLNKINPDGFIFENVPGLLNIEGGKVYSKLKSEFSNIVSQISGVVLSSENYGVPQRRKRVFLVGQRSGNDKPWSAPEPVTQNRSEPSLFENKPDTISVEEALSDLPDLAVGEDGANKGYKSKPQNIFQAFMRDMLSPKEYYAELQSGNRNWKESD